MSTVVSSSGLVLAVPYVLSLNRVSGVWWLEPEQWPTSKSNWGIRNDYLSNFREASADLSSHFQASWSVSIVKWLSRNYGRRNNSGHSRARYSVWIAGSFCLALVNMLDQYPIGLAVPFLLLKEYASYLGVVRVGTNRILFCCDKDC